jgi:diguanylate cyclase (GGDEF)-like protein
LVCRYGGDEFVVVLWDAGETEALNRAHQLSNVVREVGARFEPDVPVTASVGVATARRGDATLGLLGRADERAYEAKRAGGDNVVERRSTA